MNSVKIYERIHPMGLQLNNDVEIDLECAFDESFEGLVLTIFVAIVSYFLKFTQYHIANMPILNFNVFFITLQIPRFK